ncbi:type II toxin-antitoxin system HicB family antitoxin [Paenibacillus alkaliterrae]|uniref:type II toxin-antitoxin system HicB family antitoxin n=1 Tax=Paenibacillus alkaliterrae TaxID=320909 RepID=UPI001F254C77|nr:type II toxin-antitoxin system HicB family antitoxin [Paenibacillus alkaliterrae]MCF2940618.1 type II toxin-antitoxin system HicB family antitoxin [Paenibacillus alkaliterrae]
MTNQNEMQYQVMIEGDDAEKDFIAYIPALRLGARGESLEEVRENAKDLLMMELETRIRDGKEIPKDNNATMEMIHISLPVKK